MSRRESRTTKEINDSVIRVIKNNGALTRKEIDFHCDYERTSENHLPRMRKEGLVHIAKWEIRKVPGRWEALFAVGSKPDAPKPPKPLPKLPRPSHPDRRSIFFDETEAALDAKYRKQYMPTPARVHVGWLGAV